MKSNQRLHYIQLPIKQYIIAPAIAFFILIFDRQIHRARASSSAQSHFAPAQCCAFVTPTQHPQKQPQKQGNYLGWERKNEFSQRIFKLHGFSADTTENESMFETEPRSSSSSSSTRKPPFFPGANPIATIPNNNNDLTTFFRQTKQSSPTHALLGKPSQCACQHGYPQAYSLDPMPPRIEQRGKLDRLNSGLLKLTCPLLVMNVDLLEDEGFMKEINEKLISGKHSMSGNDAIVDVGAVCSHSEQDGDIGKAWVKCMDDAHSVHANTRQRLILGQEISSPANYLQAFTNDESNNTGNGNKSPIQILTSKLGDRGAASFLEAGVAGASPLAKTPDVKCLHAWLADYLFRKNTRNDADSADVDHPIGEAIVEALALRGVDISGTDSCHRVCGGGSGACDGSSSGSNDISDDVSISVSVPIARNKQRKRKDKELERRRRRRMEGSSD